MKTIIIFSVLLAFAFGFSVEVWDRLEIIPQGIETHIAGGEFARPNQFPYQARLRILKIKNGRIYVSMCGGALITRQIVLTAAHCLDGATSVVAFLGSIKINGNELTRVQASVWKKNIIIHKDWNATTMANDIALIRLYRPVQLNDAIKTVSLPQVSQVPLDNRMAVIAGFGQTAHNSTTPSNDLRYVYRKILPNVHCAKMFPKYYNNLLHICVDGSQRKSSCPGDLGGPLVVDEGTGGKTVVGLTSFGALKCDANFPVVFTRVSAYLKWISKYSGYK